LHFLYLHNKKASHAKIPWLANLLEPGALPGRQGARLVLLLFKEEETKKPRGMNAPVAV
jgi:hypothetical protein